MQSKIGINSIRFDSISLLIHIVLNDQLIYTFFRNELTDDAREINGALYCLRCHDTMGIPICGACHRPVEERVITALGKNWHVEVIGHIFPFF